MLTDDERAKNPFVTAQGCLVIILSLAKLARQHIRGSHREGGPLTGKQREAESCIANEGDPPLRPMTHPDLANPVEVQFRAVVESCQNMRQFPFVVCKRTAKEFFLGADNVRDRWQFHIACEHKNKQRAVIAQRKPADLPSWPFVYDICIFVSRLVPRHFERRDRIVEAFLVLFLRTKGQTPDSRVKPVRADHYVKMPLASAFE